MVLLKTFVITVILMKPHQLCPCLPLIAFLCTLFLSYHTVTVKNVLSKYKLPVLSATLLSAGTAFQIRCWAFASMNSFFFAHAGLWKADIYLFSAHFSLRTSRAQKEGVTKGEKKISLALSQTVLWCVSSVMTKLWLFSIECGAFLFLENF